MVCIDFRVTIRTENLERKTKSEDQIENILHTYLMFTDRIKLHYRGCWQLQSYLKATN